MSPHQTIGLDIHGLDIRGLLLLALPATVMLHLTRFADDCLSLRRIFNIP